MRGIGMLSCSLPPRHRTVQQAQAHGRTSQTQKEFADNALETMCAVHGGLRGSLNGGWAHLKMGRGLNMGPKEGTGESLTALSQQSCQHCRGQGLLCNIAEPQQAPIQYQTCPAAPSVPALRVEGSRSGSSLELGRSECHRRLWFAAKGEMSWTTASPASSRGGTSGYRPPADLAPLQQYRVRSGYLKLACCDLVLT